MTRVQPAHAGPFIRFVLRASRRKVGQLAGRKPVDVPDALFERLRRELDDTQLVELTNVIALENMRGRFNLALGFGAAGFSEGLVCAVPDAETHDRAVGRPVTDGGGGHGSTGSLVGA